MGNGVETPFHSIPPEPGEMPGETPGETELQQIVRELRNNSELVDLGYDESAASMQLDLANQVLVTKSS